jgi:hypothetical protein
MATREGEYPFATIIVLDGNVAADAFNDAVRNVSLKPDFRRAAYARHRLISAAKFQHARTTRRRSI